MIDVKSLVATLRTVQVNVPQTQVRVTSVTSNSKESTLDMYSHADTCVLGYNSPVIQEHVRPVNFISYDPSFGYRTYKTLSGVIRYDHPITGQTYHLVIQQEISIPHLEYHILFPMQYRVNDVTINDFPRFLVSKLTNENHSIIVTDPDDPAQQVILPLAICVVTKYFPTQTITKE